MNVERTPEPEGQALHVRDVVQISKFSLFAKTSQALATLCDELRKNGYDVGQVRIMEGDPPLQERQKNGWYTWFASRTAGEEDDFSDSSPSYQIYEAWHWAPLKPSVSLHKRIIGAAGMVSDCGYYRADEPVFEEHHLHAMTQFVQEFTTLDVGQWKAMLRSAPRTGPGMIQAIAPFCHEWARVEDTPNFGQWTETMVKLAGGEFVSKQEEIAAIAAELHPRTGRTIREFIKILQNPERTRDEENE